MMRGILAGLIQAPKAQKTVARCEREALSAWLLKSYWGITRSVATASLCPWLPYVAP